MSQFRIYTEMAEYGRATKLAILVEELGGVTSVAAPLVFTPVSYDQVGEYTFDRAIRTERITPNGDRHVSKLDGRALIQAFMDHGWELGMRPTGISDADTTKQIAAISEHLSDLRALVFSGQVEPRK